MTHPALKMYDYHSWANGVIIDRLKELPIATMLRQMGHTSVMQDYGLYLFMPQTS